MATTSPLRQRLIEDMICTRLQNQRASSQKGLAFPLKESVYVDVRRVQE
jgi:hypothetical protein